MRCGVAGAVGVLVLGWLTSAGLAQSPPPVELPMPAPETAFATSPPPHVPAEPTAPLMVPGHPGCGPGGPRILGHGYDPARGILTFTVHDDPSPLIWEGYTGHGGPPDWFTRCWGRVCKLCGR
jgi:hypothetical protein